jgi:hypothetical protein
MIENNLVKVEASIDLGPLADQLLQTKSDADLLTVKVSPRFDPNFRLIVSLTNVSRDLTCHVHAVRIVCGVSAEHNWAFICEPEEKLSITPKDTLEYQIPFPPRKISRTYLSAQLPLPHQTQPPPFKSPFGLWRLFSLCPADQSWVSIDFNEYRQREYCRGSVKTLFENTLSLLPDEPPDSLAPSPL